MQDRDDIRTDAADTGDVPAVTECEEENAGFSESEYRQCRRALGSAQRALFLQCLPVILVALLTCAAAAVWYRKGLFRPALDAAVGIVFFGGIIIAAAVAALALRRNKIGDAVRETEKYRAMLMSRSTKNQRRRMLCGAAARGTVLTLVFTVCIAGIVLDLRRRAAREAYLPAQQQEEEQRQAEEEKRKAAELAEKQVQEQKRKSAESYEELLAYIRKENFISSVPQTSDIDAAGYPDVPVLLAYCTAQKEYGQGKIWDAKVYADELDEDDFLLMPEDIAEGAREFCDTLLQECERQANATTKPYVGMAEEDVCSTDYGRGHLVTTYDTVDTYGRVSLHSWYVFYLSRTKKYNVWCTDGVVVDAYEYDSADTGSRGNGQKAFTGAAKYAEPYVGMYEEDINQTNYGNGSFAGEESVTDTDGVVRTQHTYIFYRNGEAVLYVNCIDGRVTYVHKYKTSKTGSSKTTSSGPDVSRFRNAEDFYDYYYDEFFDYYDAENYYNDHGGE